ncbi:MAG: sortase [Rhodobacteraceae bacterium]|nr:sortase [Paracoccaceae bacterium]
MIPPSLLAASGPAPETEEVLDGCAALRAYDVAGSLFAAAMVLGGGGMLAAGAATPVKAMIGQAMLEQAWDEARALAGEQDDAVRVRPWSWADIAPAARLRFPSLGEERLVLDTASGEAMAWGPGHVDGTAELGAPGVSAAAAHRDTHFALLQHLSVGDVIEMETLDGSVARYRVAEMGVVDARTWRFPAMFNGPDVLALATCWPFDSQIPGPERFVLFADRI